ncbi:T4SS efffector SepA family protein [Oceaniglobus indicus]|uniref:T4SS efffector SepA family protein n=1 Tax=Oceaniglobus indicus TaxID=2047749 RepID=UPI000C17DEE0|nr:hypothetical protein [Oceaniglobus indicus]
MMPVIRINDATFADISVLKTWFGTKSPSETIDRIVREAMDGLGIERDDGFEGAVGGQDKVTSAHEATPSLTFTKPMNAKVNGDTISNPNWASILHTVIKAVSQKGYERESLVRQLGVPAKAGCYEEEGYKYDHELDISVQGQSAADAWKEVERLADQWRIPVYVEFVWRQTPKAQHPGKSGVLRAGEQ